MRLLHSLWQSMGVIGPNGPERRPYRTTHTPTGPRREPRLQPGERAHQRPDGTWVITLETKP